jgi:DNA mismatch endonuclease (patch repair protein)
MVGFRLEMAGLHRCTSMRATGLAFWYPVIAVANPTGRRLITDRVSPEQRSRNMARIRSKDTRPEMIVRRLVHAMGYRYRLHVRTLPGCPDLVFPRLRKIIQVYGCYWHPHSSCRFSHRPLSRLDYWVPKLDRNRERDEENLRRLREQGWTVLVIRECTITDAQKLASALRVFFR